MSYVEIDQYTMQTSCTRCGFVFQFHSRALFGRDFDTTLCQDCKAKPVKTSTKNGVLCKPWDGEFDLNTSQPLKDGQPYKPGIRTCGHSDCVLNAHIIPGAPKPVTVVPAKSSLPYRKKYKVRRVPTQVERLIAEQHDLSYRTGRRLGYGQLLAAVKREGRK